MDFIVALALFLQTSGQVAEPQPQSQPEAVSDASSSAQTASPADQPPIDRVLICRDRRRAGTRVAVTECYSRSHADRTADRAHETMEQMLGGAGHNNSAGD